MHCASRLRYVFLLPLAGLAFPASARQPEVLKLTGEQDRAVALRALEARVEALRKAVDALKGHRHDLPFGVAGFYLHPGPDSNQRVRVTMPLFTGGDSAKWRQTSPPKAARVVRTSRRRTDASPRDRGAGSAPEATRLETLAAKVRELSKRVEALGQHRHELPFGVAGFYLNPAPESPQRVRVTMPIFTGGDSKKWRETSAPLPDAQGDNSHK